MVATVICADGSEWRAQVLSSGGCVGHDDPADCEWPMAAHHVVTTQKLRKMGRVDLIHETANGVPACYEVHRKHHSRIAPIARERLPVEALAFAEGLGLGWWIDKFYGVDATNPGS